MHTAFDYLLELSMSMSACDTDRDALREAHATLLTMDSECRAPSAVWPTLPTARSRASYGMIAA